MSGAPSKPPAKPKAQWVTLDALFETAAEVHECGGRVSHPKTALRRLLLLLAEVRLRKLLPAPPPPGSISEAMDRHAGLRREALYRKLEGSVLEALALVRANSGKPAASKPPGSPTACSRANAG